MYHNVVSDCTSNMSEEEKQKSQKRSCFFLKDFFLKHNSYSLFKHKWLSASSMTHESYRAVLTCLQTFLHTRQAQKYHTNNECTIICKFGNTECICFLWTATLQLPAIDWISDTLTWISVLHTKLLCMPDQCGNLTWPDKDHVQPLVKYLFSENTDI